MRTILVLNPKGGSGKSTISTNLAGFFACWGVRVTLMDFDSQASSMEWLAARPESCPVIKGVAVQNDEPPVLDETDYLIIDVPSGYYTEQLLPWIQRAERIIVPVLPSPHDIRATKHFLDWMATDERLEDCAPAIGIIANRVKENTRSFKLIKSFLQTVNLPCIGILRDTQNYVLAAQYGLSIFELPSYEVKKDLLQWQRFVKWLCMDRFIYPDVPIKPDQAVYSVIYGDQTCTAHA